MASDDPIAWLRGQIEADLALARKAADGDSGDWFMGDKWNVYRDEDRGHQYTEQWSDEHQLVVYGNVGIQSQHIARHDPQDKIADCEAKLAILAEHKHVEAKPTFLAPGGIECAICHEQDLVIQDDGWYRTVRLLMTAYRHRPGYQQGWGSGD